MIRFIPGGLTLAALTGCVSADKPVDYYADCRPADGTCAPGPKVDSMDVDTESGNMGGTTVTINGSNLGTNADDVVVTIGGHNATVLNATGSTLVVVTPMGPMSGGAVDIVIATDKGYLWKEKAYTYNVEPFAVRTGDSPLYSDEAAYVSVENLWTSCLGGMWDHGSDSLSGAGCDTVAYVGATGTSGASEWWTSPWPRGHNDQVGWVGTSDFPTSWRVQSTYGMTGVSSYDKIRRRVSGVTLTNPAWGDRIAHVDPTPSDSDTSTVDYRVDTLQFCEDYTPDAGGSSRYTADWPVPEDFFQTDASNNDAHFDPVTVGLTVGDPNIGLNNAQIRLPGEMKVVAESGFTNDVGWGATGTTNTCLDANGDGAAMLDENGIVLTWDPIGPDANLGGPDVTAQQSYVHVSITWLPLGWFGLSPGGPRASIVVPDDDGRVEIPNSVMYQFPSPNFNYSSYDDIGKHGHLGDWNDDAAYLIVEAYRYTDMRIEDPTRQQPVVLSYVTGDLSFVAGWSNPLERADDCSDCIDGDGDGWVDKADPDCQNGGSGTEEHATSEFTCNDGIDNNGDGLIDSEDPLCKSGSDGESTCGDGVDNDGDGWIDGLDSECENGGLQEAGLDDPSATCSDGLDNDGDGWIDGTDPACTKGSDAEDDGFGTTACNDGLDNDLHGDIDSLDPYCADTKGLGALATEEAPATPSAQCADGLDNDSDGFVDGFDPDCEYAPRTRELVTHLNVGDKPIVPACYDGIDNDGDGLKDADDPGCWNGMLGFLPDGFIHDEATDWGTGCTDGVDDDSDGWIDGADPDCKPGLLTTEEIGFGTGQCNDGTDNDGDGLVDKLDTKADGTGSGCNSATDPTE